MAGRGESEGGGAGAGAELSRAVAFGGCRPRARRAIARATSAVAARSRLHAIWRPGVRASAAAGRGGVVLPGLVEMYAQRS